MFSYNDQIKIVFVLLEDDCPSFVVIGLGVSALEIAYCNSLQIRGVYRSV